MLKKLSLSSLNRVLKDLKELRKKVGKHPLPPYISELAN